MERFAAIAAAALLLLAACTGGDGAMEKRVNSHPLPFHGVTPHCLSDDQTGILTCRQALAAAFQHVPPLSIPRAISAEIEPYLDQRGHGRIGWSVTYRHVRVWFSESSGPHCGRQSLLVDGHTGRVHSMSMDGRTGYC